ncbi:hypothetical protein [Streptomyces sp. NPDC059894]|uniref:hypothetical protein n=1 Tax=unclassified Streptomyces TaxID=2593676 RepID=UPI0036477C78
MATVWLKKVYNFSSHEFTVKQNDGTWRPWCIERRKVYAVDEAITLSPGDVLTFDHFFMPWADWGRTRIEGPADSLEFHIGPTAADSPDYLRGFDSALNEVLTVPMGPRGSWWSASVDLRLVFEDDAMRWVIWNANGVGPDLLSEAGKLLHEAAMELIKKLVNVIPVQ